MISDPVSLGGVSDPVPSRGFPWWFPIGYHFQLQWLETPLDPLLQCILIEERGRHFLSLDNSRNLLVHLLMWIHPLVKNQISIRGRHRVFYPQRQPMTIWSMGILVTFSSTGQCFLHMIKVNLLQFMNTKQKQQWYLFPCTTLVPSKYRHSYSHVVSVCKEKVLGPSVSTFYLDVIFKILPKFLRLIPSDLASRIAFKESLIISLKVTGTVIRELGPVAVDASVSVSVSALWRTKAAFWGADVWRLHQKNRILQILALVSLTCRYWTLANRSLDSWLTCCSWTRATRSLDSWLTRRYWTWATCSLDSSSTRSSWLTCCSWIW